MANKKCQIVDFDMQDIRWVKKPIWFLSSDYQHAKITHEVNGRITRIVARQVELA